MKIYSKSGKLLIELPGDSLSNADLNNADLRNADLSGADLRFADLSGADLRFSYLNNANLSGADLRNATLRFADLSGADLSGADLRFSYLNNADLKDADLYNANLRFAYLNNANLSGADLYNADLYNANLKDADLEGTCLDPENPIQEIETSEILAAGLQIEGEYVVGFRTKTSQHYGNTVYETGKTYIAPWFSVSSTECHPGLYLASEKWLKETYPGRETVQVRCLRSDLHKAGNKWRCKKLEVL